MCPCPTVPVPCRCVSGNWHADPVALAEICRSPSDEYGASCGPQQAVAAVGTTALSGQAGFPA